MLSFPLWPFLQNLYDLLPEQDVFLVHRSVVMEVSEEPVFIFHPLVYYLQELGEMIRFVAAVYRQSDAGRSTVGDHIVCLPICLLQRSQCGMVFFIRGQLLRPPGLAQHSEPVSSGALEHPLSGLEVRICRIQDAVFHIVALGPAHSEEGLTADLIELPPH